MKDTGIVKVRAYGNMLFRHEKDCIYACGYGPSYFKEFFNEVRGSTRIGEKTQMETRVALIGIIVENADSVEALNMLLHECGKYIVGRMGIPYQKRGISIISIAIDAPQDVISTLAGKIGTLPGITAKTTYSNIYGKDDE